MDLEDARKFLKEAVRTIASTMVWSKEQKHVITTDIRAFDEQGKMLTVWVPTGTDPAAFVAQLQALGSMDCYFSLSLTRANVFFKSRCLGHDANGFRFALPEKVFKVQRRKDTRLMIPYTHTVRAEMPDPLFPNQRLSRKVFDVSTGGISLIVTDAEGAMFQAGLQLKGITFSIRSRLIKVDGEVKHLRPQPTGSTAPGVKVGIQFTRVDAGDAAWIGAYIFEETRKYVSKIL